MIGKLIFSSGSRRLVATLGDDLRWQCDDDAERARLVQRFPILHLEDVPDVVLGRHVLYQAAERLGGRVEVPTLRQRVEKVAKELV